MTSQAVRFSRLAFAFNWRRQTPRYGLVVSFHCPGCKVLCKTQLRIVCWYPRMCRTQLRPSEQQWIKQSPANEANTGILQISLWCNLLGSQSQGPQVKACKIILLSSGKNLIRRADTIGQKSAFYGVSIYRCTEILRPCWYLYRGRGKACATYGE